MQLKFTLWFAGLKFFRVIMIHTYLCHPISQMVEDENFKDISSLESAFLKRDYEKIIKSPALFWLAFCKAFGGIESVDSKNFSISIRGKALTISGNENIITNIKKFIEEIRNLFLKGHNEKRSFVVLFIKISDDYFITEQKNDVIDLTDRFISKQAKLYGIWFEDFVQPVLENFFQSMGAIYFHGVVSQKIMADVECTVDTIDAKAFKIDWTGEKYFVYPIEAKTIPPKMDLLESMYSIYEEQRFCDLSLVAGDGVLKAHSILLSVCGSEVIQKMLTHEMKESSEMTILFNEFSLKSLKAFVDFVYLGEKGLQPKSVLEKDVDLYELFEMAHTYQFHTLIDCCTNLLSLFSSVKDKDKIYSLAKLYDNEHLRKLYEYLLFKSKPNQPEFIKI